MPAANTEAMILAMLNDQKAVGKKLAAATMVLMKQDTLPNRDMAPGELIPCTFPGYTDTVAVAFGSAFLDEDGKYKLAAPSVQFETSDVPDGQNVVGYALMNAAKDTVHSYRRLPAPITLSRKNQGFIIIPEFLYGE